MEITLSIKQRRKTFQTQYQFLALKIESSREMIKEKRRYLRREFKLNKECMIKSSTK